MLARFSHGRETEREAQQRLVEALASARALLAERRALEGADAWRKSSLAAVMARWNPLGYSADEVRRVLGEPASQSETTIVYVEDRGLWADIYEFTLSGGFVVGVELGASE